MTVGEENGHRGADRPRRRVRGGQRVRLSLVVAPSQVTEDQIAARHTTAHNLASPIRGVAILADLLDEALAADEPDLALLREISAQMATLVGEATDRLAAFATELDG